MRKYNRYWQCVLSFSIFLIIGQSLNAQSKEDLESQRIRINQEIENANTILKQNVQTKQITLDEYSVVESQIESRQKLIENIQQELALNKESIQQNTSALDSIKLLQETLKNNYRSLLRQRYIALKQGSKWQMILSSSGFKDAFLKWQYYQQLDDFFLQKKNELSSILDDYTNVAEQLNADTKFRDSLMMQELEQKKQLDQSLDQKKDILVSLESKNSELTQLLKKKNAAREKLNIAIEKAIEKALSVNKNTTKNNTIENSKSTTFARLNDKVAWPSKQGSIVSKFGRQAHPSIQGLYIENNGIDIRLQNDKNAYAIGNGKVISIQSVPGHDIMIMIQHSDYYSIYSKLKTSFVTIDQTVSLGQSIGEVNTDKKGNTKLHFEIWKGKTKLDPALWLK